MRSINRKFRPDSYREQSEHKEGTENAMKGE